MDYNSMIFGFGVGFISPIISWILAKIAGFFLGFLKG